ADWFLRFTFWGGGRRGNGDNDRGGGGLIAILFLVALVLAVVAPLIGRLVQLAVSRRREELADVSGVGLTRNPIGLARALRSIGPCAIFASRDATTSGPQGADRWGGPR